MQNRECVHHCFVATTDQVGRLRRLAETANSLFRPAQAISMLDLLYAAIWRQVSATTSDAGTMTLTILEKARTFDKFPGAEFDVLHHTIRSMDEALGLQSLVGTAQMIRRSLKEVVDDSDYEGWLIDSHLGATPTSAERPKLDGLLGSSLELPSLWRHLACLYGNVDFCLSGNSPRDVEGELLRLFCISGAHRDRFNQFDGVAGASGFESYNIENQAVSVDLWLPQDELKCFKVLYGGSCFVDDAFFEN